ncbi:MAG: DUF1476 domain-containing protein [Pseudomonadota bacterium]|nr:DUF1476 domain-containing protein [Pseudomonadota bacterium]MED5339372.1 DUF1476 domain-containing protein [Pseudomonadota bacterium]MEE3261071.1 DUF1476 domain-containing protein [Pseudomonadota bacterium]|tara:strand:- start:395 stop:718 length:324 start_codon:yes stop_codon:yes gene_type:complete
MDKVKEKGKGEEAKFFRSEENKFKITARRNKLIGLWLAEKFGLEGEAAVAYAKEVIEADLEKPGDDDVVEKILRDCKEKSLDLDESKIREQLDFFGSEALKQIEGDS